ncbi:hypothetical protein C9374_004488 [Naegleria lovaniensis]|uniref:Uncharacterized protein n=1 Tax=Naegleria lovaniensis TaxID=51637 RepID=A0AA88KNZ9_NAELO|nr:uncharacterized protein C9374_004488 [Naegleria lovaniensis]KAG2383151.1 hypothetical protein C9374_004488 [Naegleria lovaniensis]
MTEAQCLIQLHHNTTPDGNQTSSFREPSCSEPCYSSYYGQRKSGFHSLRKSIRRITNFSNDEENSTALFLMIIGFFFPFIWVVNFALFRKSSFVKAAIYAKVSLGLFLFSILLLVVLLILSIVIPIETIRAAMTSSMKSK